MKNLKIAGVQMDIAFGNVQENLSRMETLVAETVAADAWLTVFPECTTTGYCFRSLDEAQQLSEAADGPTYLQAFDICKRFETRIVYGYLEQEGDKIYNAVNLVSPAGLIGSYRKVHLPMLGVDRFTTAGSQFAVFDVEGIQVGMCICYDSSFPEASRALTLMGADIIVLPTNWPPTSGLTADIIPAARALENHIYFMAVNRVGNERGFEFIGKSSICDPSGKKLAHTDHADEAILYAEIDPEFARRKHLVNIPGEHEVHRIDDRMPGCYDKLVEDND